MGETNNAGEEDVTVNPAENGGDDQGENQKDAGADKGSEGDQKSDDDNAQKGDKGESGDGTADKSTPPADEEPKTRKRNVDFILERKNRKIEKLQEKNNGADDEDDIDSEDEAIIGKHVEKLLSPLIAKQIQDEDAQEISGFIKDNPDFAPYADKVKKFAQHPSRKDMPIKALFYEVAGDDLLKLGASRAKKAQDEAKESQAGGGSSNAGDNGKSVWDLSPEEFTAQQDAIRAKSRE